MQSPTPGLIVTHGRALTRADWVAIGIALGGRTAAVTGWDALESRDLVGGVRAPTRIVTLTRAGRSKALGPVLVRRTDRSFEVQVVSGDRLERDDVPVVSLARAVADAALECTRIDDVRALVSRAVRRGRCSFPELTTELESGPRNCSADLRTALEEVGAGARSVAEAHALVALRRARIGGFELNVPIADEHGRVIFVVDVLWRELRAVLEIDSVEYHLDRADWRRTMQRHERLTSAGLSVVHYPPSAVGSAGWTGDVARWLTCRAEELQVDRSIARVTPAGAPPPFLVPGLRRIG